MTKRVFSVVLVLCMVISLFAGLTITTSAADGDSVWTKTELSEIQPSDRVVIAWLNSSGEYYAADSQNLNSQGGPLAVLVAADGESLTAAPADNLIWNIAYNSDGTFVIYPDGTTATWLYCISSNNNGVRVGTGENKTFSIDSASGYVKNDATTRYLGVYNKADVRCYTSPTTANITGQTVAFFVEQSSGDGECPEGGNHNYVTKTTATCGADGETWRECSKCGAEEEGSCVVADATGLHVFDENGLCVTCGTTGSKFTPSYTVQQGDNVLIDIDGHVLTGDLGSLDVTSTSSVVTSPTGNEYYSLEDHSEVWEVNIEEDGTYFFVNNITGEMLGTTDTGALAVGDAATCQTWTLGNDIDGSEKVTAAISGVTSSYGSYYLEYYSGKFTTYSTSASKLTESAYGITFYVYDDGSCKHPSLTDDVIAERIKTGNYTEYVAPTCTEDGYIVTECPDEVLDDGSHPNVTIKLSRTGHNMDSGVITTAPTCTIDGVLTYSCQNDGCDYSYTEPILATGHIDANGDHICDTCQVEAEEVNKSQTVSDGDMVVITINGRVLVNNGTNIALDVDANDGKVYAYSNAIWDVSVDADNNFMFTNGVDGDYILAMDLNGNFTTIGDAATDTSKGWQIVETDLADATGALVLQSVVSQKYLEYYNSEFTIYAQNGDITTGTSEAYAVTFYKYVVCEHLNTATDSKAATCEEAGYERVYCTDCGAVLSETVIEALGHDYQKSDELSTAATCTEPGADVYVCTHDATHTYSVEIPATGHNYVNGVCTVCGAVEPTGTKYTQVSEVTSGEYMILFTEKDDIEYAAASIQASPAWVTKTTEGYDHTDSTVVVTDTDLPWNIQAVEGGYTIQNVADGKYLAYNSDGSNGIVFTDTTGDNTTWVITVTEGVATITNPDATLYLAANYGYTGLRAYKSATSEGVNYTRIFTLFKKAESTTTPNLDPEQAGASLAETVYPNVAFDKASLESFAGYEFEVTKGGAAVDKANVTSVEVGDYVVVSFPVAAKEMKDVLTVQAFGLDAEGNRAAEGKVANFNLADSLYAVLADTSTTTYDDLIVALLNYGAAAQVKFNYNTENLANSELTDEQKVIGTHEVTSTTTLEGDATEVRFVGRGLNLDAVLQFTFVINKGTYEAADLYAVVSYVGDDGNPVETTIQGTEMTISGNRMGFNYAGLSASNLQKDLTVAIYSGGTQVSQTLTYNLQSFVALNTAEGKADATRNLANAIMDYALAAENCFGATNG